MKKFLKIAVFSLIIIGLIASYQITIHNFKKNISGGQKATIFYDIDKKPFYSLIGQTGRDYVSIDKINRKLLMSVLVVEDARFFQHFGFDVPRIAKIIQYWVTNRNVYFGASTITQQLSKITLFTSERTIKRKVLELITSVFLEIHYSKKEILELYLNNIFFGKNSYGIEAASQNYFGKSASMLNLAESAMLAALIKKPTSYSPLQDVDITRTRQIIVLKRLYKLGWIKKNEYISALSTQVNVLIDYSHKQRAPYFVSSLINVLNKKYGADFLNNKGLRIYTTLDWTAQNAMERVTSDALKKLDSPPPQVASVLMENASGKVLALVGGRSYRESQFNRVTQALRPPGSAIKPFVYALAMESGWLPSDTLFDEPISYIGSGEESVYDDYNEFYEPQNFNQKNIGEITLAYALQSSNNVASVGLLNKLGVGAYQEFVKDLNLNIDKKKGLCLALGCNSVSLLNLVSAYTAFENQGQVCPPIFYEKILLADGEILEDITKDNPNCKTIMSQETSIIMSGLLNGVLKNGTGKNARLDRYAGGKTGTSDDFRDAWFIGFTKSYTSGFWLGNDDNSSMGSETGGRTPAKMWKNYMSAIPELANISLHSPIEDELKKVSICGITGYLSTNYCPIVIDVKFRIKDDKQMKQVYCPEHNETSLFDLDQ